MWGIFPILTGKKLCPIHQNSGKNRPTRWLHKNSGLFFFLLSQTKVFQSCHMSYTDLCFVLLDILICVQKQKSIVLCIMYAVDDISFFIWRYAGLEDVSSFLYHKWNKHHQWLKVNTNFFKCEKTGSSQMRSKWRDEGPNPTPPLCNALGPTGCKLHPLMGEMTRRPRSYWE